MLRVTLRGSGLPTVVLGSGETLWFGRSPHSRLPEVDANESLRTTAIALPMSAPHVSRVLGRIVVGDETTRLRWSGSTGAQLSSLFDAPGGARRVTLAQGMSALLDEGENQLTILRGRVRTAGAYSDLQLSISVEESEPEPSRPVPHALEDVDEGATAPAPTLEEGSREWYVALALAEPWLTGVDDYPRPPSNREIYERVKEWHGYAWNLDRSQRVDDSIRSISRLAFGPLEDPFTIGSGRAQNVRFAIGRRAAEVGLVDVSALERVVEAARARNLPPA